MKLTGYNGDGISEQCGKADVFSKGFVKIINYQNTGSLLLHQYLEKIFRCLRS